MDRQTDRQTDSRQAPHDHDSGSAMRTPTTVDSSDESSRMIQDLCHVRWMGIDFL